MYCSTTTRRSLPAAAAQPAAYVAAARSRTPRGPQGLAVVGRGRGVPPAAAPSRWAACWAYMCCEARGTSLCALKGDAGWKVRWGKRLYRYNFSFFPKVAAGWKVRRNNSFFSFWGGFPQGVRWLEGARGHRKWSWLVLALGVGCTAGWSDA